MYFNMTHQKKIWLTRFGGFFMALHFALIAYVNSSFISNFVNLTTINILYIIGSILSIVSLLFAPTLIRKYGSVITFLFFITIAILSVLGIATISIKNFVIILFLIHIASGSILYFYFDLNIEQETKDENKTGENRGFFLTASNLAWVLSPLAMVFLMSGTNFSKIYLLSGIALIPVFLLVSNYFKDTKKANKIAGNTLATFISLKLHDDKTRILFIQFILNFFYSWMVIYMPLLLNKEIGFNWDTIGYIFIIMLLPFILLQLPTGILSDKKIGEREILIFGFLIMIISTIFIPSIKQANFWIWAIILFLTRVGASIVEIGAESYFFKHIKEENTGIVSLFRISRPLSYVIAPLIALPIVNYFSYSTSFYFLAIFTITGLLFIPKIDTK